MLEKILWLIEKVVPFIGGVAIGIFATEIITIVILSLWRVIQWLI